MCTKDVLKDIFAGKKELLKLRDVKFISVPKYDELSVKALYPKLVRLEGMAKYFPDKYPKGRQCDRDYLFNIAQTLYPEVMGELIDYAHAHRHEISGEKREQEAVLATDYWANELRAMPYFSKVSHIC